MIIYYFGADSPWDTQNDTTIRRRNMAILLALSEQPSVEGVVNVIRCNRNLVFKKRHEQASGHSKIVNVYMAPILPERGILKSVTRPLNQFLLKRLYSKYLQNVDSRNTLAWCYWPKGYEDFEFLGLEMAMVFDTDHNIINDPNNALEHTSERQTLLLEAGKRATYIISSSRSMLEWYRNHGISNSFLMMNGVFKPRIQLEPVAKPVHYTITYAGTLSRWMKTDWLLKSIKEHSDWHFNFIGTNYKTEVASQLTEFPNVTMFGYLDPQEVDAIIKQSNVCFGLYQKDEALDVNSMKLYDYLAQGVPVVVNDYHSFLKDDFKGLLNVASTYEAFDDLLAQPKAIDMAVLTDFLATSSWQERVRHALLQLEL